MKYLFVLLICTCLCSCDVVYTQLYETKSTYHPDKGTTFENDTVRINYYFWAEDGVLAFSVYNKLSKPLYIDWKKSSFIKKDVKYDYWIDETNSDYATQYASVRYKGILTGWNTVTEGTSVGKATTVKPERITFLAPHSKFSKYTFALYSSSGTTLHGHHDKQIVESKAHPNSEVGIFSSTYTEEKNPMNFRNFLTLSTTEKFEGEFYVDNEFYVSKITEIPSAEFFGSYITEKDGSVVWSMPYKADSLFYVPNINNEITVDYRQKRERK